MTAGELTVNTNCHRLIAKDCGYGQSGSPIQDIENFVFPDPLLLTAI